MGYALFLKMRGTDDQISLGYTVTQKSRFCRCWFEHAHLALGVGSTARITVRRVGRTVLCRHGVVHVSVLDVFNSRGRTCIHWLNMYMIYSAVQYQKNIFVIQLVSRQCVSTVFCIALYRRKEK
jgi:hypothetical protein